MPKKFGFLGGNTAAASVPEEDGRVVELFRSRAELRKQHDELGQEVQRLRDRLKQQEGATARVQEMIEGLEQRLESADTGLSTLVFYHLRALWGDGREIIGLLVKDLAAKQEERERKAFALEGNRRQFQLRKDSEQQLRQAETSVVGARQQLSALDARIAKLDKWWHRWQRPKVLAQRPALQAALEAADAGLQAARSPLRSRSRRPARANSRASRSKPGAPSIWRRSAARKCCACAWRAPISWRRPAPRCRSARPPSTTAISRPACPS